VAKKATEPLNKTTAKPPKSVTRVTPRPKKKTQTGGASGQSQLHLPDGMRDKLAEAATENGRSLDDEIIYRLAQSLERDKAQLLSDRLKAQGDRLAKFEGDIAAIVEQFRLRDDEG
jgi:hypothetical protein